MLQALLTLKAAIEDEGGIAKITIAIEDEETFNKIKDNLSGVFFHINTKEEIEGLDGIKIWNQK